MAQPEFPNTASAAENFLRNISPSLDAHQRSLRSFYYTCLDIGDQLGEFASKMVTGPTGYRDLWWIEGKDKRRPNYLGRITQSMVGGWPDEIPDPSIALVGLSRTSLDGVGTREISFYHDPSITEESNPLVSGIKVEDGILDTRDFLSIGVHTDKITLNKVKDLLEAHQYRDNDIGTDYYFDRQGGCLKLAWIPLDIEEDMRGNIMYRGDLELEKREAQYDEVIYGGVCKYKKVISDMDERDLELIYRALEDARAGLRVGEFLT